MLTLPIYSLTFCMLLNINLMFKCVYLIWHWQLCAEYFLYRHIVNLSGHL